MHLSGVTAPLMKRRKTSLGTRTTPSYSPIPTPNSMAWVSAFQRASSGNVKNMTALPLIQAPMFLYCSHGRCLQEGWVPGSCRLRPTEGDNNVRSSCSEDADERDPGAVRDGQPGPQCRTHLQWR